MSKIDDLVESVQLLSHALYMGEQYHIDSINECGEIVHCPEGEMCECFLPGLVKKTLLGTARNTSNRAVRARCIRELRGVTVGTYGPGARLALDVLQILGDQ